MRRERLVTDEELASFSPEMQERVARERFGMLKPGEFLYRLVPTSKEVSGKR